MSNTVQDLHNDIAGAFHGTTVNKIPNLYGLTNRAAGVVLLDVDPKETQRIVQLSQVFNSVYDYAAPADVKGDRFIDIRPQAGRRPGDVFFQGYESDFDANKGFTWDNKLYTQWNTGVKTIRLQAPSLPAPITLTDTSTITGWTASVGASNISLDTTNNVAGGGALQFDLANGSATGVIQTTTLNAIDLSSHVGIDTLFYWVYLPTASGITNLILRWGSDVTANYYTATSTTTQQGTAFQNGWNLISVTWSTATKVGTPTPTAYDSVQLTVTYNSTAQTGLKFCNLTSNTGYIFEAVYYSKYLFRDPVTNAFQEKVVDISDANKIINLDTESYTLLFNKLAYYVAQSIQGSDAEYDANFWGGNPNDEPKKAGGGEYGKALRAYMAKNPSEAMLKGSVYYRPNQKNFGRFGNNRFPN